MNARKTGGTIFDDEMPLFALFLPSVFHRDDADLIPWALCSVCLTIFICPLIVNRRKWLAWIIVEMCVCMWGSEWEQNRSNCSGHTDNTAQLTAGIIIIFNYLWENEHKHIIIISSSFSYSIQRSKQKAKSIPFLRADSMLYFVCTISSININCFDA